MGKCSNCCQSFRDGEDFRDHLPCENDSQTYQRKLKALQDVVTELKDSTKTVHVEEDGPKVNTHIVEGASFKLFNEIENMQTTREEELVLELKQAREVIFNLSRSIERLSKLKEV